MDSILKILEEEKESLSIDVTDLFPIIIQQNMEYNLESELPYIISSICTYGHFNHNCEQIHFIFENWLENGEISKISPLLELENFHFFPYLKKLFKLSFSHLQNWQLLSESVEDSLQILSHTFNKYGFCMEDYVKKTNFIEMMIIYSKSDHSNIQRDTICVLVQLCIYRSESLKSSLQSIILKYNPLSVLTPIEL
jgi:hypothetical protein